MMLIQTHLPTPGYARKMPQTLAVRVPTCAPSVAQRPHCLQVVDDVITELVHDFGGDLRRPDGRTVVYPPLQVIAVTPWRKHAAHCSSVSLGYAMARTVTTNAQREQRHIQ